MMKFTYLAIALLLTFSLSSCGTDTESGDTGITSEEPSSNDQLTVTTTGNMTSARSSSLSLRLTDAPIDNAAKVVVTFISVELRSDDSEYSILFEYDEAKTIDLLTLQGTQTEGLLDNVEIEPGKYNEIRLQIDDTEQNSFIELNDGSVHPLKIPSGSSSGLKLKGDIIVPSNRPGRFTIDFDVRKSIVRAGNSSNYLLKPVLRLVNDTSIGHIRGTVDSTLLTDSSCSDSDVDTHNAVYVYREHDVIADDIDQSNDRDVDPVTTAAIQYDSDADQYYYEAAFLEAGNYTIAMTCNADQEDIETDDDLLFFNIQNVTVQVNDMLFL